MQGKRIDRWIDSLAKRRLLEREDRAALVTAMTQISRWVDGFPLPPTSEDTGLVKSNPQALVRAAYALARGLRGTACEAA